VELLKEFRIKENNISKMKKNIVKGVETVTLLKKCSDFLSKIAPEGKDPLKYYSTPQKLIEELDEIERENLSVIQSVQYYRKKWESGIEDLELDVLKVQKCIDIVEKQAVSVGDQESSESVGPAPDSDNVDGELRRVEVAVGRTYMRCFGKISDISSLGMLERIEGVLEEMYRKIVVISPQFIRAKQKVKDKERRDEQRRIRQERELIEQKLKIDHVIARSLEPVKKKEGRPLYPRTIPCVVKHVEDERLVSARREQRRLEMLLFGPLVDVA
jgi:hypothetical protein